MARNPQVVDEPAQDKEVPASPKEDIAEVAEVDIDKMLTEEMTKIKPMDCDDCEKRIIEVPKAWLPNFINKGWEKV